MEDRGITDLVLCMLPLILEYRSAIFRYQWKASCGNTFSLHGSVYLEI